eukprot:NODE_148_length_17471_cov_0.413136.p6 type:complete len:291 gc:universal NODE_148_length_17471_cov_0.413136:6844-5972(-)
MWMSLWLLSYVMVIAFIAMHYAANILFRRAVVEDKVIAREKQRVEKQQKQIEKTANITEVVNLPIEERRRIQSQLEQPAEQSESVRYEAMLVRESRKSSYVDSNEDVEIPRILIEIEDEPVRYRVQEPPRSRRTSNVEEFRPSLQSAVRDTNDPRSPRSRKSSYAEDIPRVAKPSNLQETDRIPLNLHDYTSEAPRTRRASNIEDIPAARSRAPSNVPRERAGSKSRDSEQNAPSSQSRRASNVQQIPSTLFTDDWEMRSRSKSNQNREDFVPVPPEIDYDEEDMNDDSK